MRSTKVPKPAAHARRPAFDIERGDDASWLACCVTVLTVPSTTFVDRRRESARARSGVEVSIFVLLELEAVDGKVDAMIDVLRRNLGDTRARQGCESVTVHQDQARPNAILLVERWATRADDDAYRAWRAGEGAITEMGGLVAGARTIRYFDDVDA
jgi:quinol monooxygenase YgiN